MAPKINLALAIHNHQPVGNFDHVFEQAYREAYLPFIELLERHPGVRMAFHYTGPVFDWLHAHRPELLERVRAMVRRGQIEIVGGAYYEAILVAIPDVDKHAQLRKLSDRVAEYFGPRPTGMWLAERVWEPYLPLPIGRAGLSWALVDDTHFKSVGMSDADLFGYYVSEEQGQTLKLFGTSKQLRYLIPWGSVTDVIDYLRSEATEAGDKVAVMGDDGEKFGHWPGTYAHCYERGWLDAFFTALEANSDWVITVPPGEYARRFPAIGRVYLPTASYAEMLEWALPAKMSYEIQQMRHELEERRDMRDAEATALLRYMRGGLWRSFMVKYPEINAMHKKMLGVHELVHALPEGTAKQAALDHLLAGQSNDAYWHGVFGGIYYSHIRGAVYDNLLMAENLAEAADGRGGWVSVAQDDMDKDSLPELIIRGPAQNLYLAPHRGGMLFEWDWRAKHFNLTAALARRPEAYHQQLLDALAEGSVRLYDPERANKELENIHGAGVKVKEWGLENRLTYDWYPRYSLLDHFLAPETTLEAFAAARFADLGDFVQGTYAVEAHVEDSSATATLARDGYVNQGGEGLPARVEKTLMLTGDAAELRVLYRITNNGTGRLAARFGSEQNFALHAGHGYGCYYQVPGHDLGYSYLDSQGEIAGAEGISMTLEYRAMRVEMRWNRPATLWRAPVETVVYALEGYERAYQSSCVLPLWELDLAPGEKWEVEIGFKLVEL
ncbi:MAG TPA: alpha-amylase/4-alpha-glucanotransferase domain-containing protein [Roseiflexaceae bacterium]